ncbi:phosphatase PAP2 family protein [Desertivirga arenae]|uniref:phosphatase PAP2 family protein n=1 Tax=Desertivirga arenae TaxID=2810309 RepID=UPI001A976743|nr:phosphatase PAP2 family protein [Pedobacter sp. SYSU D00823]
MLERRKRILLWVMSALAVGFGLFSIMVILFPDSLLDREFSKEVQEHHSVFLDALMKWISIPGYMPYSGIMIVLTAAIFLLFRYKKEALYILLTASAGIVSSAFKILINRPRPTESVVRIVEKAKHQSFPSGHVLFYVVFFGFLVLLMRHLKTLPLVLRFGVSIICLILIFTVPLSRIYLGAHWFTDVTAGFLLGLICLFFLSYFYLRKVNSKV